MPARRASGRRWLGGVLAACSMLASVVHARAAVEVPLGCGSEVEFSGEVRRRLGSDIQPLPTSLRIEPEAGGYVLRMQVGSEQRELRDPSCRELFRAAVVVAATIAMSEARRRNPALGGAAAPAPEASPAAPSPAAATAPNTAAPSAAAPSAAAPRAAAPKPAAPPKRTAQPMPTVAPTRTSEVVPEPAPEPRSTQPSLVGLSFALGAGAFAGVTPTLAPRFDLEARLTVTQFGVVAGGCWFPPASETDGAGRGVEVSGFRAALAAVWLPVELLEARFGGSVYRLSGTGVGSFGHRSDGAWSGGLMAGILVAPLRHGRLWAGAALEGEWLLVRSRFEILNYGDVFRVSSASAAGLLKLGVHAF
jgi:hypothetical protein